MGLANRTCVCVREKERESESVRARERERESERVGETHREDTLHSQLKPLTPKPKPKPLLLLREEGTTILGTLH